MHALVKHPLVNSNVEEVAFWYNQRDPDVAVRFVDEAHAAMLAAAENPLYFSPRFENVRRVRLRRFPHSVFFQLGEEGVLILAVLHGACDLEKIIRQRQPPG